MIRETLRHPILTFALDLIAVSPRIEGCAHAYRTAQASERARAFVQYNHTLHIEVHLRGGALRLLTRPGVVVDTDSLVLEYGGVKNRSAAGPGVPVELRVEIHGRMNFGQVVVRPQRRGFLRRAPKP